MIALAVLLTVAPPQMTVQDYLNLPAPPADHRIAYGADPLQFGDLRLPAGGGPHPVAVVVHGGCWRSMYDLTPLGSFCAALTRAGLATWSLEYRRNGNPGGGWPGTFADVAAGADHLRELAKRHPLDLGRVVAVGHSAGGHLALWLASRRRLPEDSALYSRDPLRLSGVVALAGIPDLRRAFAAEPRVCGDAIPLLLDGVPGEAGDRYRLASPAAWLPLGVPQVLVTGALDAIVPLSLAQEYHLEARKQGDDAELLVLDGAGHFELVSPEFAAWREVESAVLKLAR